MSAFRRGAKVTLHGRSASGRAVTTPVTVRDDNGICARVLMFGDEIVVMSSELEDREYVVAAASEGDKAA